MTMTTISSTAGQPASRNLPAGLFRVLGSLVNGIVTYFAHREAIKTLSELDDRALRDIGIEPSRISGVVRQGGIYHEILEEAAAIKADLIVMTSHRPAMRTYFLGSNAGHVVRYAKCSVLVVRH